ncbi:hypothetical protein QIA30_00410 (plasmid) [Borreliella turdi]|uniref:hypothetical protein n=1 Tax=Borreliella turdi TaxID=57863 RepID=UPI002647DBEA|nr:hypothetical protein [Borreliella turdi]WKC78483.1 hypothetical protein QIA30_00410 [Borreliella turdi]
MSLKIGFKDIYFLNKKNSINIKSEEFDKEISLRLIKAAYKEFYSNIFSNKGIKMAFRESIKKGLVEIKEQFRVFSKNYLLSRQADLNPKRAFKAKEFKAKEFKAKEFKAKEFKAKEFKSLSNNIEKLDLLKAKAKLKAKLKGQLKGQL